MADLASDAEHHRERASQLLAQMAAKHPLWAREVVENIEAAAVANVMHVLTLRLERMQVQGPARAAIEQLLKDDP